MMDMKAATAPVAPDLAAWAAARPPPPPDSALAAVLRQALVPGATGDAELTAVLEELEALEADPDTLAAAIAFANLPADAPAARDPRVAPLVQGQREADKVWALHRARTGTGAAEGLRRLLLALIGDLRVLFVLLARQLVRMRRAAKGAESERRALAELSADVHGPLANRLGVWQVKWELEDIAFRYLQPETYKRIAKLLDERRADRERFIADARAALAAALAREDIRADIAGRPKHIFSIWKKMQRKGGGFEDLYDIRALRVLVDDVPTCYAALGVVHALWEQVPDEYDDYIARPKGNEYRSLHTAVVGPGGKTIEVQIRTHQMHAHAERGVAAHWLYKEGGGGDAAFERKIAAMRALLETRADADDDAAILAGHDTRLLDDRVYVLTPQGKVVDLPRGATVLDFAYHVHTEVGHRCRGAKVDGRIANLHYQPASGETIEILTAKAGEPRRDWIVAGAGFLATGRAKEKVRAWFRHADHARNVAAGREILERELKRASATALPLESLAQRFDLRTADELCELVGIGDISASQVARALHETPAAPAGRPLASADPPRPRGPAKGSVVIEGVGNLMFQLARCCQPLPGDAIAGFVTRGRGVSIHRAGCRSYQALALRDPARTIDVAWGAHDARSYEVNVVVRAYDRKGLLKDVSAAITAADVAVLAASTRTDPDSGFAHMQFALRVRDNAQLAGLLGRLQALPNVVDARRTAGTDTR
jgi:GTP pyrophosphokinase